MNEETRTFIRVCLYVDGADQDLKGVLDGFSDQYVEAVREGLSQVIAGRELDAIFATNNDEDNRAAIESVPAAELRLAGIAVRGDKKEVDRVVREAAMHS